MTGCWAGAGFRVALFLHILVFAALAHPCASGGNGELLKGIQYRFNFTEVVSGPTGGSERIAGARRFRPASGFAVWPVSWLRQRNRHLLFYFRTAGLIVSVFAGSRLLVPND